MHVDLFALWPQCRSEPVEVAGIAAGQVEFADLVAGAGGEDAEELPGVPVEFHQDRGVFDRASPGAMREVRQDVVGTIWSGATPVVVRAGDQQGCQN